MSPSLLASALLAAFTVGLSIEAALFYWRHEDHPCTYRLFAVRDKMIRLSVEGKIKRNDPFFEATYENVSLLLRSSRFISGPEGWPRAAAIGHHLAHRPEDAATLRAMPTSVPEEMKPVIEELRAALQFLVSNHFGILLQIDIKKRESARIQKAQAKKLLAQMPGKACLA